MTLKPAMTLVVAVGLLAGCAGARYESAVASVARDGAQLNRKVFLAPARGVGADEHFAEYSAQVQKALEDAGFARVSRLEDADVKVLVAYGTGTPRKSDYGYVATPGLPATSTTVAPYGAAQGSVASQRAGVATTPAPGAESADPRYASSVAPSSAGSSTVFTHFLQLVAVDARDDGATPAWSTTVSSRSNSADLPRVFPYMVAAARGHLARGSDRVVNVEVPERDAFVAWLRAEGPRPTR